MRLWEGRRTSCHLKTAETLWPVHPEKFVRTPCAYRRLPFAYSRLANRGLDGVTALCLWPRTFLRYNNQYYNSLAPLVVLEEVTPTEQQESERLREARWRITGDARQTLDQGHLLDRGLSESPLTEE